MTPGNLVLNLYRGDTYRWNFTFWTDLAATVPADLTGVTPMAQIRDRRDGTLVVAMGVTLILPNAVDMVLAATDSANLPSSGVWDMQLTYASGDVQTAMTGYVYCQGNVSEGSQATPHARHARHAA